jgi:hypothetical protein
VASAGWRVPGSWPPEGRTPPESSGNELPVPSTLVSEPSDPTEVVVEPPPADPAEPDITDLVPTSGNHPGETTLYRTVVLTDIPDNGQPVTLRPLNEPVKVDDTELEMYTRPGEGVIITSQQSWVARGVTLGRLLHSLALALLWR